MAKVPASPRKKPEAKDVADDEVILKKPGTESMAGDGEGIRNKAVWIRGFQMLIIAVMMTVAGSVLGIAAVLQFGWLLFTGRRNDHIAGFGSDLGDWLGRSARFQTAATDAKPFPWMAWGR